MKNDRYMYPAIFDYADDGITITFPDLPGCISCADNDAEGMRMAKDALCLWLLGAEDFHDEIPEPTPLKDIVTEPNQRSVLIDVNLALHREAYRKQSVKKTLTIPMWLNEAASDEGINFSQALQDALVDKIRAAQ